MQLSPSGCQAQHNPPTVTVTGTLPARRSTGRNCHGCSLRTDPSLRLRRSRRAVAIQRGSAAGGHAAAGRARARVGRAADADASTRQHHALWRAAARRPRPIRPPARPTSARGGLQSRPASAIGRVFWLAGNTGHVSTHRHHAYSDRRQHSDARPGGDAHGATVRALRVGTAARVAPRARPRAACASRRVQP